MNLYEKLHKRKIKLIDRNGHIKSTSIKRFIPMQYHESGVWSSVYDVEVLLNENLNHYFSINAFVDGKSWIRSIEITSGTDKRIRKSDAIDKESMKRLSISDLEKVDEIILEIINRSV